MHVPLFRAGVREKDGVNMNRKWFGWCALWLCGCEAYVDVSADAAIGTDARVDRSDAMQMGNDAAMGDATLDVASEGSSDAGAPKDGADTSTESKGSLLLSYNGATESELAVVSLANGEVTGRLRFDGFIGNAWVSGSSPFLLEQAKDRVSLLDGADPARRQASWNVALSDARDGGESYSNPVAVFVTDASKALVLRYTRNQVAILDPSQVVDGGAPTGLVDLAHLVQTEDSDGVVEMTSGVFVPARRLLYVLLGNLDRNKVSSDGFTLLCSNSQATIVAIDVDTNTLVPLSPRPDGALVLSGQNPIFGGLAYDETTDRLLVVHAGCNAEASDGGTGAMQGRVVEEVSLFTGHGRVLLDANGLGFPSGFAFIDGRRAVLQFGFSAADTFAWDPTQTSLGPALVNAPDSFVYEEGGFLVGLSQPYFSDGGVGPLEVVRVRISDGKRTVLAQNPFTLPAGFPGGLVRYP